MTTVAFFPKEGGQRGKFYEQVVACQLPFTARCASFVPCSQCSRALRGTSRSSREPICSVSRLPLWSYS